MRIVIGKRDDSGVNVVEMRDRQFSADATYTSKMSTPNVVTLEAEEGAERILLITLNGDEDSHWVIETASNGDQWLSRRKGHL